MMIGLAIGDALGNTTEGQLRDERRLRNGEIRDYQPNPDADGARRGTPSDDSQMAFWTLESLVDHGGYHPNEVARLFSSRPLFGLGNAVSDFRANMRDGSDWTAAGTESAGNGALMRIAPVVIPHLDAPSPALWAEATLLTMTTHNDPAAIACSLAFVSLLWELLAMSQAPAERWWAESMLSVVRDLETGKSYSPRGARYAGRSGTFSDLIAERLAHAVDREWPVATACDAFFSGAYLLETMPCAILILMKHGHDPEEAIVRAVNDTYDNDTIGAIVGAAVGALHGVEALPARWRSGLTGRTAATDDGRIFELLAAARQRFCASMER
jgi:ADP-ribosylglycohydrolase